MDSALVTGASSGIGRELAWEFARHGHNVVLVARRKAELSALAGEINAKHQVRVTPIPVDLVHENAIANLLGRLDSKSIEVDILVNCAGVLENGWFTDIAPETHQHLIDLNISALTAMICGFLPAMLDRGRGRVLNVASTAAFQPIPILATYAATKAYVLSLGESLSEELRGTGVTATTLCPGFTATDMFSDAQRKGNGRKLPSFLIGQADEVAAAAYKACIDGEELCVPGLVNQGTKIAAGVLPRWLVRRINGTLSRMATSSR